MIKRVMDTQYGSTASFGKRQEYRTIAELLRRGFDVYMTLVDDQQIDCVIRYPTDPPQYVDVQIKARSRTAKNKGMFSAMTIKYPRPNYIFIFYDETLDSYWVMPSLDVIKEGNINKSGANIGKVKVRLANKLVSGQWKSRPKFDKYKDDFKGLIPTAINWQMWA